MDSFHLELPCLEYISQLYPTHLTPTHRRRLPFPSTCPKVSTTDATRIRRALPQPSQGHRTTPWPRGGTPPGPAGWPAGRLRPWGPPPRARRGPRAAAAAGRGGQLRNTTAWHFGLIPPVDGTHPVCGHVSFHNPIPVPPSDPGHTFLPTSKGH